MHRILAYGPEAKAAMADLPAPRYRCTAVELVGTETEILLDLHDAFSSRPPDLLLVDIGRHYDCLPIRHLRRLFREVWGEALPFPVCLAIINFNQLSLPELPAMADDFLLPQFRTEELIARVTRLLFRHRKVETGNSIRLLDLTLDLDTSVAYDSAGCRLPLTPKEFNLLSFLCSHRGKFFSRELLLSVVWGVDFEGGERTVDIHIRRIRAKMPEQAAGLLETRRGLGYGFRPSD